MSRERGDLGRRGEDAALDFLQALGWLVLERNVRLRSGELDLVAIDGPTLVFVEVKTRMVRAAGTDPLEGRPVLAVDFRKQAKVRAVAREWLHVRGGSAEWDEIRFDAVGVRLRPSGQAELEHLRAAF